MADNHSKEILSMNMSHIRSTNSKPEEIVRMYLFSKGLRYRKSAYSPRQAGYCSAKIQNSRF